MADKPKAAPDQPTLPEQTHVDPSTQLRPEMGHAETIATGGGAAAGAAGAAVASAAVTTPLPGVPASLELVAGTMVGEYRIEGKLGEGGMGQVFAAVHPVIGKRAAIKVIKLELCANAEAVERFVQEARAVNQIGHPNIVDVFAFGTLPDGRRYLVMEWLKGESLAARLRHGQMSIEEVCDVLEPIARALQAAHEKRIIHRDLKPDNVFLVTVKGEKPMVKLLDFGIAKLVGNEDTRLERTRTGSLLGTPQYISPEQARGRHIDERTDVYSLGAMAFEMFCRRPPFIADNAMDMVSSHLHDPPPAPCSIMPELPAKLDELLLSMLAKQASKRPSLAQVREALAEIRKLPASSRNTVIAAPPGSGVDTTSASGGGELGLLQTVAAPTPTPAGVFVDPRATVSGAGRRGRWLWGGAAVVAGGLVAALWAGGVIGGGGGGEVAAMAPQPPPPQPQPQKQPQPQPQPEVAKPEPPPPAPAPAPGALRLTLANKGARVEVDGAEVPVKKGVVEIELPPGEHELLVTAPGRKSLRERVTIESGAKLAKTVKLERERAGAKATPAPQPQPPPGDGDKKPPPPPPPDDDDGEGTIDPFGGKKK